MLDEYPYLTASIVLALLSAAMIAGWPRWRRLLLAGGLMALLPCALLARYYNAGLWEPRLLLDTPVVAGEDLLWAFAAGTITCFLAILTLARRLEQGTCPQRRRLQLLGLTAAGVAGFTLGRWLFPSPAAMTVAHLGAVAAVSAVVLWRQPALWPVGLAGAVGYTLFHAADVFAFTHIWPATVDYWAVGGRLPGAILRVPTFEFVWAAGFGFVWPMVCCYLFGVAPKRSARPAPATGVRPA
ncbi:MAG: hypothetical protein BIFFINMI_02167 [Phycisphaerae bacterium]|nr:hypothetical protein [Phycisphaerae bacterium]